MAKAVTLLSIVVCENSYKVPGMAAEFEAENQRHKSSVASAYYAFDASPEASGDFPDHAYRTQRF